MRAPRHARAGEAVAARDRALALVSVATWFAAMASAEVFGAWLAVGGAALALGAATATVRPAATRSMLRPTARGLGIGAVAGAVTVALSYLAYPRLAGLAPFVAGDTAALYAAFRAPPVPLVILALIPVTLGEELVWRGTVQDTLVRRLGTWAGLGATAGVYALANAALGSLLLVAVALAWGAAWGALRILTGSLVPALVAHLVWSAVVLLGWPLDAVAS